MNPGAQGRSRLLARNSAMNAAGQLAPLLLAIPVLPFVLTTLGTERFAVLTLAWTVIGYFGFLDLGLGRAATKYVAAMLGEGRRDDIGRVVWSSVALQALLGVAGAAAIAAMAPFIAADLLRISDPALLAETRSTLIVVALGLPLVLLSGTFSGVLEAHQRFELVNLVRVPANVATLAIPAAGAAAGISLPGIVTGIVIARACAMLSFAALAARAAGGLRPVMPSGPLLRQLLGFGGWLTLSLLAAPVLTYAERLLIGGLRSLTELAYYAVPFEIVARTAVIPSAVALTLFPAFSYAQGSRSTIAGLFRRPLRLLFLLQWPLLVVFWFFPSELLAAWMNEEVARAGAHALRLLALAFFFNGFAQIALAGVQGLGRPDLKAKLDLVQVPLYIAAAALLTSRFGVTGAASAKLLFTLADMVLLFVFARRLGAPPLFAPHWLRRNMFGAASVALLVLAAAAAVVAPLSLRIVAAVAAVFVFGGAFWLRVLEPGDRAAVRGLLSRSPLEEVTP
ncbi:MAG TPA: MATE family efflux transporter [Longimicrobiales bacterium]|nr:MATE family efflux transporter [Longimicrobiales bacterium]